MRPACLYYVLRQTWFALLTAGTVACAAGSEARADAPSATAANNETSSVESPIDSAAVALDTASVDTAALENLRSTEIWLFSTRHLPGNCLYCNAAPKVYRGGCCQPWQPSSVDEFRASCDPSVATVFFIHGNRIDADEAVQQGMTTFARLRLAAGEGLRVRFVIWSWPSEPMIPIAIARDADLKAGRTDTEAHYVANVLAKIPAECPLSMIGFSFGARITSGALHLLGGGAAAGYTLAEPAAPRTAPTRAVLVAAAMDCDWLVPNRRYGLALAQVDRVFLLVNSHDIVLSHYPNLSSQRGVEALGFVGVCCASALGDNLAKVYQQQVATMIGKRHAWTSYLGSPQVMALVRDEALWGIR
ncbi:MAG TPA: hypothetical protein VG713_03955 [Pirellulales bacterium]|nr:hypothetical protein [Pirellulales bacterium]